MSTSAPGLSSRVVVTFDPNAPDNAALELALRLAPGGQVAGLLGLYVEETDALTLGEFPWAREIATATAESRPLDTASVERHYRQRSAAARALFEAALGGTAGARFESVRGHLPEALTRLARDAAGVLMDWPAASRRSRPRATSVVEALLQLPAPLVGLIEPRAFGSATILIVAGEEPSDGARALARQLAGSTNSRIRMAGGPLTAAAIMARGRLEAAGTLLVRRKAAGGDESMLAELALDWPGSLLLLR
ncbi:MAG TPA: hypothetical protein VMT50_08080 [Steroidobacteraceae bacterium]|nr:hypothetical protein [Steroidobacteraceae bacterium]